MLNGTVSISDKPRKKRWKDENAESTSAFDYKTETEESDDDLSSSLPREISSKPLGSKNPSKY